MLNMPINTKNIIMLFYTVAPSGESLVIKSLQPNSCIGVCCTNDNAEWLQIEGTALLISS